MVGIVTDIGNIGLEYTDFEVPYTIQVDVSSRKLICARIYSWHSPTYILLLHSDSLGR